MNNIGPGPPDIELLASRFTPLVMIGADIGVEGTLDEKREGVTGASRK